MKSNSFLRLTVFFLLVITSFIFAGMDNQSTREKVIKHGNIIYLSNTVMVKLKSTVGVLLKSQSLLSELEKNFGQFKFSSVNQIFKVEQSSDKFGLDNIMQVNYQSNEDPYKVTAYLKKLNNVEWAEPRYLRRLFKTQYTPNDSLINNQYYLKTDHIYDAWNVTQGDTSIVIGIVDTGVDWPHPDLYANIWHNWKDIKTGWAGDQDGIKYDSIGWDFGGDGNPDHSPTPDSNPIEDAPVHGTLVAGVASAVTNNKIGVAGIGFKSKIMPVKVAQKNLYDPSTGEPYIDYGFEGIKYAADNGAKVINCSWGGGGFSQTEQDVINYAISKGALVVVAAGNDSTNSYEYPAAYQGVLTAASTNNLDQKSVFSNYGSYVDVCAPGEYIWGTFQPDKYAPGYGTSFSAPQVSGLAALVFAKFPNYTPLQVAQQIRVNCDNIDALNPGYKYQLGSGRINAYKALMDTNSIAMRAVDFEASDSAPGGNGNGILEPGETIEINVKFKNYLKPVNNVNISLVSMSSYATITKGDFSTGSMGTLDSTNNSNSLYEITLSKDVPFDYKLQLRLDYSGTNYTDFQLFNLNVNTSYVTQSNNNVTLTITSKGNFGYNDYANNLQGEGFRYKNGESLLFEGALMYGTSSKTVNDEARGANQNYEDSAFTPVVNFHFRKNNKDVIQGVNEFNDFNSANSLGIDTKLETYSYTSSGNQNYIILNYNFKNTTATAISNFYAGIFCDWDMFDPGNNYVFYDTQNNFGYAYYDTSHTWIATAVISSDKYGFWPMLNDGSDGGFNIYNGFTPDQKWQTLSSGIHKTSDGPGDISEVTSSGPYEIQPGQIVSVAFALAGGNNLSSLKNSILNSRTMYGQIITSVSKDKNNVPLVFNLSQNYPNPFNPSTTINFEIPKSGYVTLKVFDTLGREIANLLNDYRPRGNYHINFNASSYPSGIYFYRLSASGNSSVKKMILLK